MEREHDAAEYGRHIAAEYDAVYDGVQDTRGAVEVLTDLAAGGPVLELGAGTGRLVIPMARAGLSVHAVDGSEAMLDQLRAKPGGDAVATTVGDFSTVRVPGAFSLVALVTNTVYALPDQEAQVRCFANAAAHLRPGGRFVVEAWIPKFGPEPGPTLTPRRLAPGHFGLVMAENDPVNQLLSTTQVVLGGSAGVRVFPVVHRYAHPAELDLMARLAGLELEHRWSDWRRTAVTATSTDHVSVYRLAGG